MRTRVKGRFFSTTHVWFESFETWEELPKDDRVVVHMNAAPELGGKPWGHVESALFRSLVSGLDAEPADWNIAKRRKSDIRRCGREGVEVRFFRSEEILRQPDLLDRFDACYREMFQQKDMVNRLPVRELLAYAASGNLLVSAAMAADTEAVWHSYVYAGEYARQLQSCSLFRGLDSTTSHAVGRANAYLSYRDMEYLKEAGVRRFDWGGISSLEAPNGIDTFKMQFGGEQTLYYSLTVSSRKSVLLDRVKGGLNKLRRP